MLRLHVLIGIPGSGKSSWAEAVLEGGFTHRVSTDAIRADESLFPGGYRHDPDANQRVFDEFYGQIDKLLTVRDVIADATNLQAKHRAVLIDLAEKRNATLHYIFFTNVAQAVLRNARREGWRRVPDEAMLRFVSQYEVALKDVLIEPYDHLTYIERTI